MDIRNHLNLIYNHGYKGSIAIYMGPDLMMTASTGDTVLVQHQENP